MTPAAFITELKGNSLDDGPGIRSVIFFKGCPLRCAWCHNPETQSVEVELALDSTLCVGSGDCAAACEPKALAVGRTPVVLHRDRCTECMACVAVCPSGALQAVGKGHSVEELVERVRSYVPFYQASGGGVTLSGGEPTLPMAFGGALLRALKDLGVHTLLETCGEFPYERFVETMLPHLDEIWFDLKLADDALHRQYCGTTNRVIFANFARLLERFHEGRGPRVLPRIPLVPGITTTADNLRQIADFLRHNGVTQVALLPYNPLWTEKAGKLGRTPALTAGWMPPQDVQACRDQFQGFEIR